MVTAALLTIVPKWKQPKCPSTDEWTEKLWYSHVMGYYQAVKRSEVLTHAPAWMNLGHKMPREGSQSQGPDTALVC